MIEIKFTPLGDKVIIQPVDVETKTKSGLIIPEASRTQLPMGIVLAVGAGKGKQKTTVKQGDKVLYHVNAGGIINLEEGDFLMMSEFEIYGIL